ncbi:MAG: hypothetical protein OTI36_12275 [Beijerinckiaceae bacterium]|nr:hypothetical protein [Beijerinckiaceae bacterium]
MDMDQSDHDPILAAPLRAEIEAVAARENRSARDVLQEAVERYLRDRRSSDVVTSKARDAAARMLERRHRHRLPDGESIRSLMVHGRM